MTELGQLDTLYGQVHNEGTGVEFISFNGWDTAYTQYDAKYNYYGRTLQQDFLDGTTSDFYAWRMPGSGWYSQTSVVGTTGKIYWMEAYSFNEAQIKAALRRTINGDTEAPYCLNPYPGNGATGVDVNTMIYVNVKDDGSGVDKSATTMTAKVQGGGNVPGSLTFQDNFFNYRLKFDPTSSLPPNSTIIVEVNSKDLFNNSMQKYTWNFTTGASNVAPVSFGKVKAVFK